MALELVTPLPPGAPSHTRLARHGARLVVLREILDGTDCSWPDPSPQLVTLQEVGELQGKRHALFPWVPGVTLRETLEALELVGSPVPLGLIGRVLVDTARSLAAITPARPHGGLQDGALQLGFDGKVSVLDYGAPRVTRFRPLGRVNFAADVFALGGVLHAALTGFQGPYATAADTLPTPSRSHPEATPALDDVVLRALSPEPDERQASAGAFADELEAVLGTELFSEAQLAEVVRTLFKDRIKLLQSLGGIVATGPNLEAELPRPSAPIPMGTQPGVGGAPSSEPTLPRAAPSLGEEEVAERTEIRPAVKPLLPWDSGKELDGVSEGTQPGVPAPTTSQRRPNLAPHPLEEAVEATNPRAAAPALEEAVEATNPRAQAPAVEATNPRAKAPALDEAVEATNPRVRARASREADAAPKTAPTEVPEDTNPRALGSVSVEDTAPRPRPSAARAAAAGPQPAEPPRPRFTTEAERLRARGQERLKTPPQGTPAVEEDDDELRAEPTAVRKRVVDPQRAMETAQKLPAVGEPATGGGGGTRVVMAVLLLVVVGLAGAIGWKVLTAPPPELPFDEEFDAGAEEVADAAVGEVPEALALIPALDAGSEELDGGEEEDDEELDGGEPQADGGAEVDAGATLDAGAPDAGPAPVKKVVKKKKKRRRRR